MKLLLIRLALVVPVAVVAGAGAIRAQQPPAPNSGVQVAVPQGNAQDQANTTRQQQQQQARAKLANLPAPRTADGHIVLGNTSTLKGVWVGGGLGFCNSNTVAAPASLNPGAAARCRRRGCRSTRRRRGRCGGRKRCGGRCEGQRWCRRGAVHAGPVHGMDPRRLGRSPAE